LQKTSKSHDTNSGIVQCNPACHSRKFRDNSELARLQNRLVFRTLWYTSMWLYLASLRNLSEYHTMIKILNLRWIYIDWDTIDFRGYANMLLSESVRLYANNFDIKLLATRWKLYMTQQNKNMFQMPVNRSHFIIKKNR
jgi:hypothetical protein